MQGKLLKAKVLGVFLVVAAAVSVVVAAVSTPLLKQAAPSSAQQNCWLHS